MKKRALEIYILALAIIGIVFISGCIQEEGITDQNTEEPEPTEKVEEGILEQPQEETPAPTPTQPTPADLTQLTFLDDLAGDPDWSPDGSQIVFWVWRKT